MTNDTTHNTEILAWWFAPVERRYGEGDGGVSESLIDALLSASDSVLHRVRLSAADRTILWTMDCTDILRAFARECALEAIKVSGWEAPPRR